MKEKPPQKVPFLATKNYILLVYLAGIAFQTLTIFMLWYFFKIRGKPLFWYSVLTTNLLYFLIVIPLLEKGYNLRDHIKKEQSILDITDQKKKIHEYEEVIV